MIRYVLLALAFAAVLAYAASQRATVADLRTTIAETEAADARALAQAHADARSAEAAQQAMLSTIAQTLKQEQAHADADHDKLIDDLRADTVRLRDEWQCKDDARVPETGAAGRVADGAAEFRNAGAADFIRNADRADAIIRALQAAYGTCEQQKESIAPPGPHP